MTLTRESIKDGLILKMVAKGDQSTIVLTEEQRDASRHALLDRVRPGSDVWVFGYGSLIWNPAFHFREKRVGRIWGYHRQFCLWVKLGRGTPECPGLMLGLEPGGSCQGVAYRIAARKVEEETAILWRREMVSGAYAPRWMPVHTDSGVIPAIVFAINRHHERYTGVLAEHHQAKTIAQAQGRLGACADYLFNTVEHLAELGIRDQNLCRMEKRVRRLHAAAPAAPTATIRLAPKTRRKR
ncbi:MAG: gamma-glutamylcyclotransferase [Rhodospirillales bacterium]|nr:gamma-glutamylcyclotransferase [Rhodospirillales bacterium]